MTRVRYALDEDGVWRPSEEEPVLPYAGTSGWSGSSTSEERALNEDASGVTARRQHDTIHALGGAAERGLTWRELAGFYGWHHGQASGSLSTLHKGGRIARLTEKRDRCKVYVLHEYVNERPTEDHGRATPRPTTAVGQWKQAVAHDQTLLSFDEWLSTMETG